MGTISATPRNELLGALSDLLASAKSQGNRVTIPESVPLLGGSGLGDMILGRAPEEISDWSYGSYPMTISGGGTGSYIPQMKTGRGQGVSDAMFTVGDLAGIAKLGPKAIKTLGEHAFTSPSSASPLAQMGTIDPSKRNFFRNLGSLNKPELTSSAPLTQIAEQVVPESASSGMSRRGFLGALGAGALSAITPGVLKGLSKVVDEPLLSAGVKAAEHVTPHVASAVAKAVSEGLPLKDALLAVSSRIAEHNKLAKEQAKARAEVGITDLLEGHVTPMKTLRAESGIFDTQGIYQELAPLIKKHMGKTPPLTKQQKLENKLHQETNANKNTKYWDEVIQPWKDANPKPNISDYYNESTGYRHGVSREAKSPELNKMAEEAIAKYDTANAKWRREYDKIRENWIPNTPLHKSYDDDLAGYAYDVASEVEPKTIQTGWADNPEITSRYVPGIGHYIEHGHGEMPYYIKAPDAPLPDEVIAHEYLNTLNELGIE